MPSRGMAREILTVKDLASYMHCHESTIYRLVKHRELPAFRLGGAWRFRITDIDRWSTNTKSNATR
jgi:excisionase family DNA binding protein